MAEMKLHLLPKDQIWKIYPERDYTDEEIQEYRKLKLESSILALKAEIKRNIEKENKDEFIGYISNTGKLIFNIKELIKEIEKVNKR